MNSKFYIVAFQSKGIIDSLNEDDFHKTFTKSNLFTAWMHYIDTTYIVKTDELTVARDIALMVREINKKQNFIVTKIDLHDIDGYLPKKAWQWVQNQIETTL